MIVSYPRVGLHSSCDVFREEDRASGGFVGIQSICTGDNDVSFESPLAIYFAQDAGCDGWDLPKTKSAINGGHVINSPFKALDGVLEGCSPGVVLRFASDKGGRLWPRDLRTVP